MTYDVLALGDYFFDQIFWGVPSFPQLGRETYAQGLVTTGGAMFITAVAFSRLGVRVGWPATFGTDHYSAAIRALAEAEGVDLTLARTIPGSYARVTSAVPYNGERAFITHIDPEPTDLVDYWVEQLQHLSYRHVHLGGMIDAQHFERIASIAHEHGATVSSDCQDGEQLDAPCDCREQLGHMDIFMPNAREARIVAEVDDTRAAVEKLLQSVPIVVVKDGGNGAWVGHQDQIQLVKPIAIDRVIDTTGAGDCFNAGFLYGYLIENAPLERCALYGNICGGLSVTAVGGATNAPTRDELLQHAANAMQ